MRKDLTLRPYVPFLFLRLSSIADPKVQDRFNDLVHLHSTTFYAHSSPEDEEDVPVSIIATRWRDQVFRLHFSTVPLS